MRPNHQLTCVPDASAALLGVGAGDAVSEALVALGGAPGTLLAPDKVNG